MKYEKVANTVAGMVISPELAWGKRKKASRIGSARRLIKHTGPIYICVHSFMKMPIRMRLWTNYCSLLRCRDDSIAC